MRFIESERNAWTGKYISCMLPRSGLLRRCSEQTITLRVGVFSQYKSGINSTERREGGRREPGCLFLAFVFFFNVFFFAFLSFCSLFHFRNFPFSFCYMPFRGLRGVISPPLEIIVGQKEGRKSGPGSCLLWLTLRCVERRAVP